MRKIIIFILGAFMMSCSEKKQDELPEPTLTGKWETIMYTTRYRFDGVEVLESVYNPPFDEVQDPIESIRFTENMMYIKKIADSTERAGVRYAYKKDIRQVQIIDTAHKYHPFCFVDTLSDSHWNIFFAEVNDTADTHASSIMTCIFVRK